MKVALAAAVVVVAAIWAFCAFLWLSPLEPELATPVARQDAPYAPPALSARPAVPATTTPPAVSAPRTVAPVAAASSDGPAREALAAMPQNNVPSPLPAAAPDGGTNAYVAQPQSMPNRDTKPAPQYSALGGYVFDGDSVVVAPPVSADGPNSPAEQRRRTRLSTDISKLP